MVQKISYIHSVYNMSKKLLCVILVDEDISPEVIDHNLRCLSFAFKYRY